MFVADLEQPHWAQLNTELVESMQPGPHLAAYLDGADVTEIRASSRVDVLKAELRMASAYRGRMYRTMASIAEVLEDPDLRDHDIEAYEMAAAEVRTALRLTKHSANTEMALAMRLTRHLPQVLTAMESGTLDLPRMKVIDRETGHLSDGEASNVVDVVLEEAPRLTTGELAARIRELCIEQNPEECDDRYENANDRRMVIMEPTTDGTAHIHALDLAPHDAKRLMNRLQKDAMKARRDGSTKPMDQLRADALTGLGVAGDGSAVPGGTIDVVVDVRTLAGLTDQPAHLNGYGPVIAEVARKISLQQTEGTWRYTLADGDRIIDAGPLRRRPSASLRRLIEAKDRRCVFPGCRTPSSDCDIDHRTEYQHGGATTEDNLAPLCRKDHRLKSTGRWSYEPTDDGDYVWTSPLGIAHTKSGRAP